MLMHFLKVNGAREVRVLKANLSAWRTEMTFIEDVERFQNLLEDLRIFLIECVYKWQNVGRSLICFFLTQFLLISRLGFVNSIFNDGQRISEIS